MSTKKLAMKTTTIAWVLGGALAFTGSSLAVMACSSSSGGGGTPSPDSGTDTGGNVDGGGGQDTGMTPDTGDMPDTGANEGGGNCTHGNPPSLHPSDGGATSLFCAYKPGDGGALDCNPRTQICCIGGTMGDAGFADPVCGTPGTACSNGTNPKEIDCEDPNDCATAGSVCCITGHGTTMLPPTLDPACNFYYLKSNISTHCVAPVGGGTATCPAGDRIICTSNAQCPTATPTCTPFKSIVFSLGFCQ